MRPLIAFSTLCGPPAVLAHWTYNRLVVNGEIAGEPWEYIRRPDIGYAPLQAVNSTDMRCNSGASSGAALGTSTLTVAAGSEVGFGLNETFGHPGPQLAYLSRVPDGAGLTAATYDGAGGWAKIYAATTQAGSEWHEPEGLVWAVRRKNSFLFTLPPDTPPGEYLLRAEGIALHAAHKLNREFWPSNVKKKKLEKKWRGWCACHEKKRP